MCRMRIRTHPFAKRLKRLCLIITRRALGQSPKGGNSALLKCRMGSWTPNILPRLGAFQTLLYGFLIRSLHLDVFSSLVYDFFISILDNSGFFWNHYLVDKYTKINLDKIQIIHIFIVIKSSLLFLYMHPYFKHYLSTNHKII